MDNDGSFTQFASSTGESEVGKDTFRPNPDASQPIQATL